MRKVFDDPSVFDEDDNPCRCECGNWFDLDGGYPSIHGCKIICQECYEAEEYEEGMMGLRDKAISLGYDDDELDWSDEEDWYEENEDHYDENDEIDLIRGI